MPANLVTYNISSCCIPIIPNGCLPSYRLTTTTTTTTTTVEEERPRQLHRSGVAAPNGSEPLSRRRWLVSFDCGPHAKMESWGNTDPGDKWKRVCCPACTLGFVQSVSAVNCNPSAGAGAAPGGPQGQDQRRYRGSLSTIVCMSITLCPIDRRHHRRETLGG